MGTLIPDPWEDPKSRSTLGFCNLHRRGICIQSWKSPYSTMLYHTVLNYTVLYHTILCHTILYSTRSGGAAFGSCHPARALCLGSQALPSASLFALLEAPVDVFARQGREPPACVYQEVGRLLPKLEVHGVCI